jgi:hypothetical protein
LIGIREERKPMKIGGSTAALANTATIQTRRPYQKVDVLEKLARARSAENVNLRRE